MPDLSCPTYCPPDCGWIGIQVWTGELDVMAPVLMPALLSGLAANIVGLRRPATSPLLASFEVKYSTEGFGGGPPVSGAPGSSHDGGRDIAVSDSVDDVIKYKPYSREMSQQYSPITDVNPEDIAEIIIDDSDDLNKTIKELQSPVTELTPSKKRGRDEPAPSSSPSKRRAPQEPTTATPLEDDLPSGVRLVDILPKLYDTLSIDHPWVHKVRCSLLGLEVGTIPSQEDIDSSEQFVPRAACKELEPPQRNNRTLVASSLGGGPPTGVFPGSIHYEGWVGPFVHIGQSHKIPARSIICLFQGCPPQPVGCSASAACRKP